MANKKQYKEVLPLEITSSPTTEPTKIIVKIGEVTYEALLTGTEAVIATKLVKPDNPKI